jgi:ankyrin repeat protein
VRQNGKRALSAAVKFGHREIARLLLERGADPNWPESDAPRGAPINQGIEAPVGRIVSRLPLIL